VTTPVAYEPGLTNSKTALLHISIDSNLEANKNPKQELDEGESIQVLKLELSTLYSQLEGKPKKSSSI
jgi:hypothetical protein